MDVRNGAVRIFNGLQVSGSGGVTGSLSILGTSSTTGNAFIINNSTPLALHIVQNNGQQIIQSPVISLSPSQSAYIISQSISQSTTVGAQVYGVNITPRFQNTTSSQTQTAFRINALFTGSFSGSTTQNIIADFGATNVGSQLVITDVVSGSIWSVNDISGLPIAEAFSDGRFVIWDYPQQVLVKSGSNITIGGDFNGRSGSLSSDLGIRTYTGSFTLSAADRGQTLFVSSSASLNVTVPFSSSVNFPIGTQITFCQSGSGQIVFITGSGVTIQSANNANKTRTQFSGATIVKQLSNTWWLTGDITV